MIPSPVEQKPKVRQEEAMLWVLKYKTWNQASHQPRLRVYTEWGNCPKHTYPNLTKEGENLEWFYFKFSHTHTKGPGVPGSIREFFQIFNGKIIQCLSSAVPSRGQKEKLCTSLKFVPVFGDRAPSVCSGWPSTQGYPPASASRAGVPGYTTVPRFTSWS